MKKRFLSKSLIAKIALVLVIILVFEFSVSEPVQAASLGGQLLNPIVNLVVYLADGVMQILQSALTSIDNTFSYIDITEKHTSWWVAVGAIVLGVLAVVGAVALVICTGGAAAPAIVGTIAVSLAGTGLTTAAVGGIYLAVYPRVGSKIDSVVFGDSFVYSKIHITPETILKNQIKLFDVNYFQKLEDTEGNTDKTVSLSNTIRNVISQVYTTIRDVALVAMLIVIIYVAIRMLIALTPKEKSRYKESAINCVIGLVLILLMHFVMSGSVTLLEMITNSIIFTDQVYDINESEAAGFVDSNPDVYNNAIQGVMLEIVGDELYDAVEDPDNEGNAVYDGMILQKDGEEKTTFVKASNFTEQARYMAQKMYELKATEYNDDGTVKEYDRDEKTETWAHIGWAFVYIMLVVLTLAFIVMYAKRTLYMAALTMFAPIVGVMYPINRVNGGRSHALNLWFKEYIGNLIIQPFHLLLYTIFIGSAMAFAIENPIYVIIAIMGMMAIERLLRDLLGIQDTRIGSLGKSLQDTTRAIKTTEKAATSIAKTVGRTISRGTHALGSAAVGVAAWKASSTSETTPEEGGVNNINSAPRVQQVPPSAGQGGGGNLPPPTAGAQNPQPVLNEGANNGAGNGTRQPLEQSPQNQKPLEKKLDEVATMQKYMSQGGRQNADGHYFNPYTDEFDENYNPLNDPQFQVHKEIAQSATMQRYMSEGGRINTNGEYFNPYTDEFDESYDPLKDPTFQVYGNENAGIEGASRSAGALDNDTLSMVDSLNGARAPFTVIEGASGDVGDVLRTDGYRDLLGTDNDQIVRMETRDMPDDTTPMASALSPAVGAENINMTVSGPGNLRTMGDTGDIESVLETGNTSTSRKYSSGSSGVTSFGTSGGAQNIPDGNNLRVVNDLSNNGNVESPIDFTSRKEDILAKRTSAEATTSIDDNVNNNENTNNIHRLTSDEYETTPPNRDNFQAMHGVRTTQTNTNTQQSNSRTNVRNTNTINIPSNNNVNPAPANNNASQNSNTPDPTPQNNAGNPTPANNNAPQNNSGTNAGGQTNNRRTPTPTNNNANPAPQNNTGNPAPANNNAPQNSNIPDPVPQNNNTPVGAGPVSARNKYRNCYINKQ